MIGRTNTGGGGVGVGGSELMIFGGTTRPSKAAQNTIWINTDVNITSYVLSVTEPTNPVEGMAWVTIGDSGSIKATNPIGDEWITVYPLSAKQYISGAWVDKTAKSYQNGEWVDWIIYAYKPGMTDVLTPVGWKAISSQAGAQPTITYNNDHVLISITGGGGSTGVAYFEKKNFSNVSRIHVSLYIEPSFDQNALGNGTTGNCFGVWEAIGSGYYVENFVAKYDLIAGQNDFDIPTDGLNGEYYMGVGMRVRTTDGQRTKLYEVKLIP